MRKVRTADSNEKRDGIRRETILLVFSELGLVSGSVAVFVVFLTVLLRVYFPIGTSVVSDRDWSPTAMLTGVEEINLAYQSDTPTLQFFIGELLNIQRRVQRRGANSLTWTDANIGDTFSRNDAVQTFARSTALLQVNAQSRITIGENSLIVFENQNADPFLSREGSTLVMIDGELSGTLSSEDDSPFSFGIALPNSDVTLVRNPQDDDVRFLITVNEDQSTTVNLHGGSAEIVDRDGKRRRIGENESATIDATGRRITLSKLPDPPRNTGPANHETAVYRTVPQKIDFSWSTVPQADRYHLVVARDAQFSDRVVDDDVLGTSFRHGALGPGTYYWHVRSRRAWSQSDMSPVRRLEVIQDITPPRLELEPPPATLAAGEWRLHGSTDAGAAVFVDEVEVENLDGRIDHAIKLKPGANVIVVKAIDSAGNLNYASLAVNAK